MSTKQLQVRKLAKAGQLVLTNLLSNRKPVAYVGGWLGKDNLGDEALYAAMAALLPQTRLFHYDGGRIANRIIQCSPALGYGVLGGGTLIGQSRQWLDIAKAFQHTGRTLLISGTGVEDESFWPTAAKVPEWIPILAQCPHIGVRGPISQAILQKAGVHNVEVIGDPALAFARQRVQTHFQPKSIGLNVGVSDGKIWGKEDQVSNEFVRLATLARQAGWSVHWFVVWPKDLEITRRVAQASGTSDHIHQIYTSHVDFIERVAELSVFAGMKLHATILAICATTPSLMIEYRPKCRDFMAAIGHEDHVIRTDAFLGDATWERITQINADRTAFAERLLDAVNRLREHQIAFARKISGVIAR